MADCGCEFEVKDAEQKSVLYWLLAINSIMFVLEIGVGWYAQSTALIADSIDMLADAAVYLIALYAVGRALSRKARAARISGIFQFLLALLILLEIGRRLMVGSEPVSLVMMSMGSVALIANIICLMLIHKHRSGEVHMRASWIFSTNDVIANVGVIISGLMVMWLHSHWPDLLIGGAIALMILNGARLIVHEARIELSRPHMNASTE